MPVDYYLITLRKKGDTASQAEGLKRAHYPKG